MATWLRGYAATRLRGYVATRTWLRVPAYTLQTWKLPSAPTLKPSEWNFYKVSVIWLTPLRKTKVVYHLHGQTSRFTVWVNGSQSSGLVNFVPESRFPFVEISSINRKTAVKAWNWYQRWLWRNGTRISLWNIPSGKTGLPFQMFRCSWKFSVGKTQIVAFHLLCNRISRIIFVNGKQPKFKRSAAKVRLIEAISSPGLHRPTSHLGGLGRQ